MFYTTTFHKISIVRLSVKITKDKKVPQRLVKRYTSYTLHKTKRHVLKLNSITYNHSKYDKIKRTCSFFARNIVVRRTHNLNSQIHINAVRVTDFSEVAEEHRKHSEAEGTKEYFLSV